MDAKARILVIDDDELVLATIKTMLTRAHYDVALAASGDEGIAQLLHKHFDLVLCDVVMPGKDGPATLRSLKAIAPTIPVVMMASGPANEVAIEETGLDYLGATLALGGARVIEKPFHGSELVAVIYGCLAYRSIRIH
jgi:CheY-like chemotaxis protein